MLRAGTLVEREREPRRSRSIERNAQAQAQLVEDLLDVSRIMSGKLRLDFAADATSPTIVESRDRNGAARRPTPRRSASSSMLEPRRPPVHGDAERLQQVVWNLLSNAVKFTPRAAASRCALRARNAHVEIDRRRHRRGHRAGVPAVRVRPLPPGRRAPRASTAASGSGSRSCGSWSRCTADRSPRQVKAPGWGRCSPCAS